MEQSTEKRKTQAPLIILTVILALGMTASCALSAVALLSISRQSSQVNDISSQLSVILSSSSDRVTQEDDVKVAGEYKILSTLPISDAYKSGNHSTLNERQQETLELASNVLREIITDDMTDYEKEKAVYDWMCANLHHEGGITVAIPTTSEDSSSPHGVLSYKSAVCVGFATTFRLFMQMLDIECKVVHNSYHSWNLVKLDGDWYHIDIYSDVESGNYANFNMTDGMCAASHDWDTSFFPAATGLTYCYAYQNATQINTIYDLPANVRQAANEGKSAALYFLLSDTDDTMLAAAEHTLSQIDSAVSQLASANGTDMYMDHSITSVEGKYLLSVSLYCSTEEDGEDQLSEEELTRIQQAVEDAFGDVLDGDFTAPEDDLPIDLPVTKNATSSATDLR